MWQSALWWSYLLKYFDSAPAVWSKLKCIRCTDSGPGKNCKNLLKCHRLKSISNQWSGTLVWMPDLEICGNLSRCHKLRYIFDYWILLWCPTLKFKSWADSSSGMERRCLRCIRCPDSGRLSGKTAGTSPGAISGYWNMASEREHL